MPRITPDAAVQSELASRGITEASGVFGEHKVQLGNGPVIRLDEIQSAKIPYAGYQTAIKIERGRFPRHRPHERLRPQ